MGGFSLFHKLPRAKKEFMQALITLMEEKPFPLIKITEVCQAAGYKRGTFYKHYDQKEQLLEELLDIKLIELNTVLEKVAKNHKQKNQVESLIPLFYYVYDNRYFFSVILGDYKIVGFRQRLFEAYRMYLAPSFIKPLPYMGNDTILKDFQLDFVSSTWLGVSLFWINKKNPATVRFVTEQFIKIIDMPEHEIFSKRWHFRTRIEKKVIETKSGRAREAFQIALIKLLMTKEYRVIRIHDILEMSGYNRSSFYLNFKDKEDLFNSLRKELTSGMIHAFCNGPQRGRAIIGRDLPIVTLFDYLYENRELLKLMYSSKAVPGFFNYMFNVVSDFFTEELSNRVGVDETLYSNFLTTTLMTTIGVWFTHGVRYSPEFMANFFLDLLHQPSTSL